MEMQDQIAAQAPNNVGKGKVIATPMLIVLATWNAARATMTVWDTTVILPLDFRLTTTAAMIQQLLQVDIMFFFVILHFRERWC